MKLTNQELSSKILQFAQNYCSAYENKHAHLPEVAFEPEWISPCQQSKVNEQTITWQPVPITQQLHFSDVENALELTLHADIKTYFTSIYSESIPAQCSEGKLALLFAWNENDFFRLQENIIGHVLMKQKLKQTITLFFAVTEDDEYMLSMNNETGAIGVERVGCEQHKIIAQSLAEFLTMLSPIVE
jgi:SecY interacting protein Syd